jgi:hypothetical protein
MAAGAALVRADGGGTSVPEGATAFELGVANDVSKEVGGAARDDGLVRLALGPSGRTAVAAALLIGDERRRQLAQTSSMGGSGVEHRGAAPFGLRTRRRKGGSLRRVEGP